MMPDELLVGFAMGVPHYRENKTESYVSVPPAFLITDSNGATWTLGSDYVEKAGTYFWNILRNDRPTGEHACKLEYRVGKLRALTPMGSKMWHERKLSHMNVTSGYWL